MQKEKKENKLKTAMIAFAILAGFYILTKILNHISTNPGKQTYEFHCAGCHGKDGMGLKEIVPPLAHADWLEKNQDILACVIRYGMKEKITVNNTDYEQEMLGLKSLSEIQIANIINYINSAWGNDFSYIKVSDVEKQLKNCNKHNNQY
jgi:mono/diheme cytochrome c family protein